jgi:hypothetical protein
MSTRNNNILVVEVRKQSQRVGSENPTNLGFKKSTVNYSNKYSNNFSKNNSNGNLVVRSSVSGTQKISIDLLLPTINSTEIISSIKVKQNKFKDKLAEVNLFYGKYRPENFGTKTPDSLDYLKETTERKFYSKTFPSETIENSENISDVIFGDDGEGKSLEQLCDRVSQWFYELNHNIHILNCINVSLNLLVISNKLEQFYDKTNQGNYFTTSPSTKNDPVPDKTLDVGQEVEKPIDKNEKHNCYHLKCILTIKSQKIDDSIKEEISLGRHIYVTTMVKQEKLQQNCTRYIREQKMILQENKDNNIHSKRDLLWKWHLLLLLYMRIKRDENCLRETNKGEILSGLVGIALSTQRKQTTPDVTYESPPHPRARMTAASRGRGGQGH